MTVWYKQGVCGDINPIAQKGLGRIAGLFGDEDLYITSIRDGNHMAGSLHYVGLAFDFRYPKRGSTPVDKTSVRGTLGEGWDVVMENNHIHVEYDPKRTH